MITHTLTRGVLLGAVVLAVCLTMLGQGPPPDSPPDSPPASAPTAATQPAAASGPRVKAPKGFSMPSGANVAIIPIDGEIYGFVLDSLERRVKRALDGGASVIVLELNTYGGTVISAMEISKYIKTLPVPTVAWVHNKAYSAGIMIASACDQMVMSPASATGDCAPIVPGMELAPAERSKALSPILAEFRDNARDNGYDFAPFHAMCVLGVRVYYVQHKQTGEQRLVNQIDYDLMVHGPGQSAAPFSSTQPAVVVGVAVREVATQADDFGQWEPVTALPSGARLPDGLVHAGNTYLTLNQTQAQDIGLSQATLADNAAVSQHLSAASHFVVPQTWSEGLAAFLTSPLVRGILMVALLVGAYLEFQAPGLGAPGVVAAVALITLLGAPFMVGLAEVWHIILFFLGFILLVIEIAFTPSFGLLGVAGLIMMFIGLVLNVVPTGGGPAFGPISLPPSEMWRRILESLTYMIAGLVVSMVGFYFTTKYFGQIPGLNRLVLTGGGPLPDSIPHRVSGDETIGHGRITVDTIGQARTDLHPSGQGEFGGQTVDVVTQGDLIDTGKRIRVIEVRGNRIVVEQDA